MNINSQQLQYFMELASCLNFTRAAANLYVAQPTLSQQIADLEAQLGVTLFNRSSRSVTLTPVGTILQAALTDISARFESVHQRMLLTAAGFSGSLTVGFLDIFLGLIPQIMQDFKNTFPDVVIKPSQLNQSDLMKGLKNETIDVAFTIIPVLSAEEQPLFDVRKIISDPTCFVLPEGLSLPTDASGALPLILWDESAAPGFQSYAMECLRKHDVPVSEVILTDSLSNLWVYLESRSGFTVLSKTYAGFFPESTQFIPIPGEVVRLGLMWRAAASNPTLPLFLDAMDQFFESHLPNNT